MNRLIGNALVKFLFGRSQGIIVLVVSFWKVKPRTNLILLKLFR